MKNILTAAMISFTLLLCLQDWVVIGIFKLNQDYIIEKLCVNKEVKVYTCNGHCQLNKVLAEKKDTNNPEAPLPELDRLKVDQLITGLELPVLQFEDWKKSEFYYLPYQTLGDQSILLRPPIV